MTTAGKLPQSLSEASYARLEAALKPTSASAPVRRTASKQPAAPGARMQRVASLEDLEPQGFKRVATCLYKKGHAVWELRASTEGDGFDLVRKTEERAVDLREQGGA